MKQKISSIILFICQIFMVMTNSKTSDAQVKIGAFADAQYCDSETKINRYYRNSPDKLSECISTFNNDPEIEFVVGLGDLIDQDFSSFKKINAVLETSEKDVYQVTGNHDLSVKKELIDKVPEQLNLKDTYYTISKNGWVFIFLDGNGLTLQSTNPQIVAKSEKIIKQLKEKGKPNANDWNGGIDEKQIRWLNKQLTKAEKRKQKAILFCHYPLLPYEAHALWNAEEIRTVLEEYKCVKAWINGHNHAGNYVLQDGIHYITMRGMVDTETENAYSIITFSDDKIKIEGFGREVNRNLAVN